MGSDAVGASNGVPAASTSDTNPADQSAGATPPKETGTPDVVDASKGVTPPDQDAGATNGTSLVEVEEVSNKPCCGCC